MRHFLAFIFLVLVSKFAYPQEKSNFISKIDYDPVGNSRLQREEFSTFSELQIWAYYQGWNLDPDGLGGGIQNGIVRMIPPLGMTEYFFVDSREKESLYLHLDLTRYTPGKKEFLRPQVLRILINGKVKSTIEVVGKKNFTNPVIVELDPGEFSDSRIRLDLQPVPHSGGGKFWGVWDIYLSRIKDSPE